MRRGIHGAARLLGVFGLALTAAAPGTACRNGNGGSDAAPAGDASSADAASDAAPRATDAAPGTDAAPLPPGCDPARPLPPSDERLTLLWDGDMRELDVHVPPAYDRTPMALVINFHGYTSDAVSQEADSAMNAKADEAGFIAVHPEGTGLTTQGWNAGACCGAAAASGVDDVGFVDAMITALMDVMCVDAARVYATGFSNGAFLSHRLACELADRIAAIAPVSGVLGVMPCTPARAVPVMHFHGDADPVVPYDGNALLGYVSVAESIDFWRTAGGCGPLAATTYAMGSATCETWSGCTGGAEVVLCTIAGGGHCWPGGPGCDPSIDATDAMWDFFVAHPM